MENMQSESNPLSGRPNSASGRGRRVVLPVMWAMLIVVGAAFQAFGQKDSDAPTALVNFVVLKEDNGKPVRNAAVILHPVNGKGKQERGGLELKTNQDGKTSFDGVPVGPMRVQVIAPGFQTYGEDFDVKLGKLDVTIRMKRPKGQYSIYDDQAVEKKDDPKDVKKDAPATSTDAKRPRSRR
jgi:hypothetical protein